jgi:hypothetical protein
VVVGGGCGGCGGVSGGGGGAGLPTLTRDVLEAQGIIVLYTGRETAGSATTKYLLSPFRFVATVHTGKSRDILVTVLRSFLVGLP